MSNRNANGTNNVNGEGANEAMNNQNANNGGNNNVKKDGIFKRFGNWCKRNKKNIAACAGSFVGGAGAAIGGSILYSKHKEKKLRNAYVPQEQPEYSPLDPNVE